MIVEVTRYSLEMNSLAEHRPKTSTNPDFVIREAAIPLPELNHFFYTAVGGQWYWVDRLDWTYSQWLNWVDRLEHRTWIAYLSGTPAGYFELESQLGGDVEIAYFGLLPRFVGMGLGGPLLSKAVEEAWAMKASRLWVHTCSLDHPGALANYLARGFKVFKEETFQKSLPDSLPGNWPDAGPNPFLPAG
jgi:GNAT superfamily N-acetyltransferase